MLESKRAVTAAAIMMALLAVSVGPVSADHVAVVAEHTTGADFEAGTLTGVTVDGTGEDASVALSTTTVDSFENQPADAGIPDGWEAVAGGAAAVMSVTTEDAYTGSQSLKLTDSGKIRPEYQPSAATTAEFGAALKATGDFDYPIIRVREGGTYVIEFRVTESGGVQYYTGSSWVDACSKRGTFQWVDVSVSEIDPATDTYTLTCADTSGTSTATDIPMINPMDSGWTDAWITANNDGIAYVDDYRVQGRALSGSGSGGANGAYIGAALAVDGAQQARTNLTIMGGSATVTWQGSTDGSTWTNVSQNIYTTNGSFSAPLSGQYSQYRTVVEMTGSAGDTVALDSTAVTAETAAPTVVAGSATPRGGTVVETSPTLSVDVADADFATAQGDNVTVEWLVDGQNVATEAVQTNATVTHDTGSLTGGDHTWAVTLTDRYGHTEFSGQFEFKVPSTLTIYNETAPSQVIDEATAKVTFYGENGGVFERSTSDGTIDMSGLPADQRFEAVISAPGYRTRTIVIDSLFEQQSAYLLPLNHQAATVEFVLQDETGRFSRDSTLAVEKSLNVSGNATYQTITGSTFDATGHLRVTLDDNTRYRLRVTNPEGETRVLNKYTTNGDDPNAILPIGRVRLQGDRFNDTGAVAQARIDTVTVDGNQTRQLRVLYYDGAKATQSLTYRVYERGNVSNVLVPELTETTVGGYYVATYTLPESAPADVSYVIDITADRGTHGTFGTTKYAGDVGEIAHEWGIDPGVLALITWIGIVALSGLVVIVDARAAALVFAAATAFGTFTGMIHPPGVAVALCSGVAVLANLTR